MIDSLIDHWQPRIVWFGFLVVAFGVFVSMPVRNVGLQPLLLFPIGAAVMAFCVWRGRRGGIPVAGRWIAWLEANSSRVCFWAVVAGVLLRVLFLLVVPVVQVSDFQEYLGLARKILSKGELVWDQPNGQYWYAYRPPGYPAFLAAAMAIAGDRPLLPAALNIVLYVAAAAILRRMSLCWTNPAAAAATQVLFAFWPDAIVSVGLAQHEPLFIVLVYLAVWLFLRATGIGSHLVAGLVTAASILVRQTLLPIPVVWLLRRRSPVILAAVASMTLMVGAWGIRNHRKGVPVLISSNIGSVIYPAAFDGAKEEYDDAPVVEMFKKAEWNEYRQYAMMTESAKRWIIANPGRWTILLLRRLPQFLGEDGGGMSWVLKVGHNYDGQSYLVARMIGQGWWVLVWILAAVAAVARRDAIIASPDIQFLLWVILLFVVTALPFITQARYHAGLVPAVLLLSGWAFRRA